ncbi:MAG: hypothetical protein U1D29_11500 [Burkholderiales bacterium]|nr:hypothetical protein [Burkholderiales bacterium]
MLDSGRDQAAGLRRLMRGTTMSVVSFPGNPKDKDTHGWVADIARSLRAMGRRPIVVDGGSGDVSRALGVTTRRDLIELLRGDETFDDVAQVSDDGVYVIRAGQGIDAFVASGAPGRDLLDGFARLSHAFDVLLLVMPTSELACLAGPRDTVPVIGFSAGGSDIANAYLIVKNLCLSFGYSRFSLVVHDAPSHQQAVLEHSRFAMAARAFLNVEISLVGWTPLRSANAADHLCDMALRRVADALLRSCVAASSLH